MFGSFIENIMLARRFTTGVYRRLNKVGLMIEKQNVAINALLVSLNAWTNTDATGPADVAVIPTADATYQYDAATTDPVHVAGDKFEDTFK